MALQKFIDSMPILGVFVAFAIAAVVAAESGYRLGRWWQERTPEEKEGPTPMIVSSLLALMAFLLAITMGMASDRFDARRALILAEANALGTTYLRSGYLPEPAMSEVRALLREYVPLRIATNEIDENQKKIAQSAKLHGKLWSLAESLARATPNSHVLALFIESLNEALDLCEKRTMASIYGRVPETILALLLLGSMLTLAMVGYSAGLTGRRSPLTALVLIALLGAVITLVFDLDRPLRGFLVVGQQPIIELQQRIEASFPAAQFQ